MLTTEKICIHIMKMLHTPVRAYNSDGVRTMFKGDDDINDPLSCDAAFEAALIKKGNSRCPVLYFDKAAVLYVVVKGEKGGVYILGPLCCSDSPTEAAAETVKQHNMDASYPYRLPTAEMNLVYEAVLLLHESVSDSYVTREQMIAVNFDLDRIHERAIKTMTHVMADFRERGAVHNPYSQELREQESIRMGNIDDLRRSIEEVYSGETGRMAVSGVRSAKNVAISVLAVSARSAIAGGVLPEIAFSLSDAYAMRIEEAKTETETEAVLRAAEFHFTELVREQGGVKKDSNPLVDGCRDYVVKHITERITLSDVAAALSVSASYLSDLFSKQEGITLSEYILKEKVEFSKRQLAFTNCSFGDISEMYSFSSQSHFGRVFKRFTGVTPGEYRGRHKITEV